MQNHHIQTDRDAESALQAIEKSFGLSIALHDLRGTICHPDGRLILPRRHLHRHPCCLHGRKTQPGWDARCFRQCFTKSENDAAGVGRPFLKSCWKGLTELVVPLMHDNHHQLTIYAGVFKTEDAETNPEFPDDPSYAELLRQTPEVPDEKTLDGLGALLTIFGHGLLHCVSGEDVEEDPSRGAAIRRFIETHAHTRTSLHELARHLHLSPSRASHAVHEYTGMTFNELLLKERMTRARLLLKHSPASLDEVAADVGMKNSFYFNRVFKRFYGVPPGKFRREDGRPLKKHSTGGCPPLELC